MKMKNLILTALLALIMLGLISPTLAEGSSSTVVLFRFPISYTVDEVPGRNYVMVDPGCYWPSDLLFAYAFSGTSRGEGMGLDRLLSLRSYINNTILTPLLKKYGSKAGLFMPAVFDHLRPRVVIIGVYNLSDKLYDELRERLLSDPVLKGDEYRFVIYETFAPHYLEAEIGSIFEKLVDIYINKTFRVFGVTRTRDIFPPEVNFEASFPQAVEVIVEYGERTGLPKPSREQVVEIVRELREIVPAHLPLLVSITNVSPSTGTPLSATSPTPEDTATPGGTIQGTSGSMPSTSYPMAGNSATQVVGDAGQGSWGQEPTVTPTTMVAPRSEASESFRDRWQGLVAVVLLAALLIFTVGAVGVLVVRKQH